VAGFGPADVRRTIDSDLPGTFPGLRVGPARCPSDLDPQPNKPGAGAVTVAGVPARVDRVFDPPGSLTCVATPAHGAAVRPAVTDSDKKGSYTFQPGQDS
jgi:hypothetical protein